MDMVSLPESMYTLSSRAVQHVENVVSERVAAALQQQTTHIEALISARLTKVTMAHQQDTTLVRQQLEGER